MMPFSHCTNRFDDVGRRVIQQNNTCDADTYGLVYVALKAALGYQHDFCFRELDTQALAKLDCFIIRPAYQDYIGLCFLDEIQRERLRQYPDLRL